MPALVPPVHSSQERVTLTKLAVSGYKSVAKRCEIQIRPLTVLAGANSSGKSSIIQPLLLLKQTLEETYDPGPLLLYGPNVKFTNADEILSKNVRGDDGSRFSVELYSQLDSVINRYVRTKNEPISIESTEQVNGRERIILRPSNNPESLVKQILDHQKTKYGERDYFTGMLHSDDSPINVTRNRCFLEATALKGKTHFQSGGKKRTFFERVSFAPGSSFNAVLRGIIHLPGLRGNPERGYPVTAVGNDFPGSFEKYVASVITAQQNAKNFDWMHTIASDLQSLGLTWKVQAVALNEAQVSLRVGRLPKATVGGARDLVSIADVGVGVSQVLPVVVGLEIARPGQIVYIEQPEIHLHPRAHEVLASILCRAANRGVQVIVETHSDLLLLGLQSIVAKGEVSPDLIALHWFQREKGSTKVSSAHMDEAGAFGDWPVDFTTVRMEVEDRFLTASETRIRET